MKNMTRFVLTLALGLCVFAPVSAFAQAFSGTTGVNTNSLLQANCTSTVRRLEVLVSELEEFAEDLRICNESEQIFNGTACVDPARIGHEWVADGSMPSGLALVLRDGATEVDRIEVILGRDGEDAACPDDPDTPVEPDPPVSCSSPWGSTVAHGSSITAYDAASVPAGETCDSQTRSCNDGTLSGTYTQETCYVEDPEPEPEPSCTWTPRGPYGTQPGVMMATMDMECGPIHPSACQGCTSFPAQTCSPGGPCAGPDEMVCLNNQRSCRPSRGGEATIWDRYLCVCR